MKTNPPSPSRRVLLGASLAASIVPGMARGQPDDDPGNQVPTAMRVRMSFQGRSMDATLYGNPAARDFFSMLPLDLTIKDYGSKEKIAYLPHKLTEAGSGPFGNEQPYDLCYYVPWGNLAMFRVGYKHPGLIRLGRFDRGQEALHLAGEFPLRVERLA